MNMRKQARSWRLLLLPPLFMLLGVEQPQKPAITPEAVIAAINELRKDPAAYAARLESRRSWYRGRELRQPGSGVVVMTTEGLDALNEAIDTLKAYGPLPSLTASAGIAGAARDHARDMVQARFESHTGSNGSTPDARMMRYGTWKGSCGEALNFARSITADDIVIDLIVDDGVTDRSHRHLLLNGAMQRVGVALLPHPRYGLVCVIDMAEAYTEGKAAPARARR